MTEPSAPRSVPDDDLRPAGEQTLLDLVIALGGYRRVLLAIPLATALLALVVSLLLPNRYTATTRVLPPQQGGGGASALLAAATARLGVGALSGPAGAALGIKNPADLYVGMMSSATIEDAIIERFDLRSVFGVRLGEDARRRLEDVTEFTSDKSGIISVAVQLRDPVLAAGVANAYVEELHKLSLSLALTEAAQRRLFFERLLEKTKDKIATSEVELRKALDAGGLVSVDAYGRAVVETGARLRAEISAQEVQLESMRAFATEENPDVIRVRQQIAGLRKELGKLESGIPGGERDGNHAAPGRGFENLRLLREVKYNETLFEMLAQQYELARADEAKDEPLVQVLDRATPPERKSWPRRGLIVIASMIASAALTVAGAYVHHAVRSAERDPVTAQKIEALRSSWTRRRRAGGTAGR